MLQESITKLREAIGTIASGVRISRFQQHPALDAKPGTLKPEPPSIPYETLTCPKHRNLQL